MAFVVNEMPRCAAPALLEKLSRVETATVGHFEQSGFMHRAIQAVVPERRIAGTAVTLAIPGQDSTLLHHVVGLLRPGDVLVVDRLGDDVHACVGGGVAAAIKASGAHGVVVDGPCTDFPEIREYDVPVWCRGPAPITTRLHGLAGSFNVPISCGGVAVRPGDLIVADFSGVIVLAPDRAEAIADTALARQAREPELHRRLFAGEKIGDISGASEMVAAKRAD